jgi:MinD-like ATPase involved in chromosome partitioning or flagellar assembly
MNEYPVSDVGSLCEHVQLEPQTYKLFSRLERRPFRPQPGAFTGERGTMGDGDVAVPMRVAAPLVTPFVSSMGRSRERWQGLRSLAVSSQQSRTSGLARQTDLAVFASCGGAGSTTVIATLGRIFSGRRNSMLLLDGTSPSVLPFYFGCRATVVGSCAHMELREETGGTIHVVSPRGDEHDWVQSGVARARAGSFNRVLADVTSGVSIDAGLEGTGDLFADFTALVVLVPDLRCAVGIPRILESFRASEQKSRKSPRVHFLLNKFDPNVALHVEMRARFERQLDDALLPFVIRRSEQVSEALAEGLTVVDYAPEAGISKDFARLADWMEAEPAAELRPMVAGAN